MKWCISEPCSDSRERERERERASELIMARSIFLRFIAHVAWASAKKRRNQISSSTSRSSFGINYEVFLSYRDADTCKGFVDHLYSKLVDAGIEVFKDDKDLSVGEVIKPGREDVIKSSTISIVILSEDYASTKNCRMEMIQMWECRNGHTIIPIFYDISPSDVKHLAGDFGSSFHQHEKDDNVDSNNIKKWKEVLGQIGGLSGYERKDINGGHESQLAEDVLRHVKRLLKKDDQNVTDKLVGIDLHIQEMMTKLGIAYSDEQATKVCVEDVRVVRICGKLGVGKTTLAKVVFNKIHKLFDGNSFLEGITSERVKFSQEMLIADLRKEIHAPLKSSDEGTKEIASLFSNAKVLIVLDNVQEDEQIKKLAGKLSWFGPGSRIIVTTNRRNVLDGFYDGVVEEYMVEPMSHRHALQLFRKHAFQGDAPQDIFEYDTLSIDIVKAIGGLPSSIVLQASRLCGNSNDITIWRNTLESLKKHPEDAGEAAFETSCSSARESARESKQANWSMAFLIFLRVIAFAVVAAGKKRTNSESSSTSSWTSGINYEVFLSFRGRDTRTRFTDHLYSALVDARISVFRDNDVLRTGEEINLQLIDAIKGSKVSIAVFSKDYASSKSCLKEAVQMWECRKSNGQTIIPIFYDVSPFEVKHHEGEFGSSFRKHEQEGVNADQINSWKEVLQNIGKLKGHSLEDTKGRYESQLVKEVVGRVKQVLKKDDDIHLPNEPVGVDLHVHEIMRKLGVVYRDGQAMQTCGEDVRVIGICGMPGIGKTTLAKVVYNKIRKLFKGDCSFVEDINSKGVESSQERLIAGLRGRVAKVYSVCEGTKEIASSFRSIKVLIVLDNVRENEQIKALAGNLTWFGPGSRIIVTTDRSNVLDIFDREAVAYEVGPMRDDHALQLFRKHVFHRDAPKNVSMYNSLSIDIVKAIGGFPLAIELTASTLSVGVGDMELWEETLEFLKENQEDKVKAVFMNSYESLDDRSKEIFLDIACFFIGKDKRIPSYMWTACRSYPLRGIKRLCDMHLIKIGENYELRMPTLLREFGRNLVKCKVPPGRCRFWSCTDALSFWAKVNDPQSVEGIGLTVEQGSVPFECEKFRNMLKLRYLRLDRAEIVGNTENLPPELRWIDWRDCLSIPELRNMHLKKLVILDLSWSPVPEDSQFLRQMVEKAEQLKVLILQGCFLLGASLNFPAPINLEILILEDCTCLSKIEPFISGLEKLEFLNLRKCSQVKRLPQELGRMKRLRELLIDGTSIEKIQIQIDSLENLDVLSARDCKDLKDISTIGRLRSLTSLDLDGANIDWDPETFEFPQNLQRLSLRKCLMVDKLPCSIGKLKQLEVMDLSFTVITEMPTSVEHLINLKTLKMEGTCLQNFPENIVKLGKLEEIDFSRCRSLGGQVCCDISGLSSLKILRLTSSSVAGLPQSMCCLSRLQTLDVFRCNQLHTLPKLPSSLLSLRWGSKIRTLPHLSYLTNLKVLCLEDFEQPIAGLLKLKTPNIGWITRLTSLETLELSLPNVTNLPGNFSALTQLRELSLSYMEQLDLTQLPLSASSSTLCLKHCKIPEPKFSSLKYLSALELDNCTMEMIIGFEDLKLLEVLKISGCNITDPNGLRKIDSLRNVKASTPDPDIRSVLKECRVELDACG